ncbi:hypothetical protein V1477_013875 [Vespula maculifrons]|uniref:Uncharacterized protein n=1 Tax=Vespula maculifrons TaxID=7453 RepID=A0ABD2BPJ0_VESMC
MKSDDWWKHFNFARTEIGSSEAIHLVFKLLKIRRNLATKKLCSTITFYFHIFFLSLFPYIRIINCASKNHEQLLVKLRREY